MGKTRMMELMMKWMPSCREVSGLVAEDRLGSLPPLKRLFARMHLSMCSLCGRFARQLKLVEKAFGDRWKRKPNAEDLAAARQRLLKRLSP